MKAAIINIKQHLRSLTLFIEICLQCALYISQIYRYIHLSGTQRGNKPVRIWRLYGYFLRAMITVQCKMMSSQHITSNIPGNLTLNASNIQLQKQHHQQENFLLNISHWIFKCSRACTKARQVNAAKFCRMKNMVWRYTKQCHYLRLCRCACVRVFLYSDANVVRRLLLLFSSLFFFQHKCAFILFV